MTSTGERGRLTGLDGLRGVAALVVLLHHGLLVLPAFADPLYVDRASGGPVAWLIYSPLHIFWAGTEAVLVFFVLSGVVLTLPVKKAHAFDWRAYYPSRLVRLYLPVAASLVLAYALVLAVPRSNVGERSLWIKAHDEPLSMTTPLRDALLITGTSEANSPLWSLRWEVLFSLLLPLYIWASSRRGAGPWLFAAYLVCIAVGATLQLPALEYLPVFGLGVLLILHMDRLRSVTKLAEEQRWFWPLVWVAVALGLTSLWPLTAWLGSAAATRPATLIVALAAVLAVAGAVLHPAARRILSTAPVRWLGRVSFSLYLTHEPIVVSTALLLPPRQEWLTPVLAIPVALLVAEAFYRYVEAPSHSLAVRIRTRVHARDAR